MTTPLRVLLLEADQHEALQLKTALTSVPLKGTVETCVASIENVLADREIDGANVVLVGDSDSSESIYSTLSRLREALPFVPLIAVVQSTEQARQLEARDIADEILVREEANSATLRRAIRYAVRLRAGAMAQRESEGYLLTREKHSQALLRLSRRIERARDHVDILSSVREALEDALGFSRVWLYQLSDDGEYLDLILEEEGDKPLEQKGEGRHLKVAGDRMLEEIVTAIEPVVVEDARTDPRTNKTIVAALGNRTIVNIPILLSGRTLGAFGTGTFGDEGVRPLTELERQFLAALGSHVAAVLDRVTSDLERRRAVESLQLFRTLVDRSNEAFEVIEPETGRFLDVSDRGCSDTGFSRTELLGMTIFDIDPTLNRAGWPEWIERLRQLKCSKINGIHCRKDGSQFPVEVNVAMVALDREYLVSAVRDVTQRVEAEAAMKERRGLEAQLARLAATAPGAIYSFRMKPNSAGCFPYASQQLEELLGFPLALLGEDATPAFARVHPEDLERLNSTIEESARTLMMWTDVFRYNHPQKGPVWIEGRSTPVQDADGELIWHGFMLDVTERKQLEEQFRQAQKMEAIGQLAGGIAHDFNNLLFVISGYADLCLTRIAADHPLAPMLGEIRAAGEQASGLTRQLLAFSRRQVLDPKVLCLNDVIGELEGMLRRLIGEDIALKTAPAPKLRSVKIDPGQIQQVVMNLAVNARDAMPQVGCLTIKTSNFDRTGAAKGSFAEAQGTYGVLLEVADTGSGIPPNIRERIFDPFFSTKDVGRGTGLGLAVVHGIVTQSGGAIEVQSDMGEGTAFRIFLPCVEEEAGNDTLSSAPSPERGSETILLAEDEALVRRFAAEVLQEFGYTPLKAASGAEAIALAEAHPGTIDLLITDVVMPEMNGRHLAEILTERYPRLKVLYFSGYTDDAVVRNGVRQSEVDFLQKPVLPDLLAEKVREILDRP